MSVLSVLSGLSEKEKKKRHNRGLDVMWLKQSAGLLKVSMNSFPEANCGPLSDIAVLGLHTRYTLVSGSLFLHRQ